MSGRGANETAASAATASCMPRCRVLVVVGALLVGACERAASPPDSPATVEVDSTPAGADSSATAPAPPPDGELRAVLERLLRGPDEPAPAGEATSWFSAETAGALRSVAVDADGNATVDFRDLRTTIPNASSSAGSRMLLDELNAAVFSVAGIASVQYTMDGSCDLFWEWLQYGCTTVTRAEYLNRE
jgi:hypothetical protein